MNAKQVREYIDAVNPKMTTPTPRTDVLDTADAPEGAVWEDVLAVAKELRLALSAAQEANKQLAAQVEMLGRQKGYASAQLAQAQEALRFVERWANHHGVKPCVKPEHALSTIQHYPPILAITESYADGKVPETRNPWAELAAAQEWKERVLDELIVAHIYTKEHDTNPKKAIHDAIVWNCQVAIDPAVSSDARKLIAQERERCAKVCQNSIQVQGPYFATLIRSQK